MADRNNPDFLSASTIKGDKVVNAAGEDLGKIEELMIDLRDGRLAFAVLSFGGFLGLGDKLFAIPWQALRLKLHDHAFVLDVPKDLLEKAEGFDKDNWPITSREWLSTVYGYYGYQPYWQTGVAGQTGISTGMPARRESERMARMETERRTGMPGETESERMAHMGSTSADRNNPDFLSAGTLKGDKVVNTAGEDIGKIEEFMIDLQDGKVGYVVISHGGLLGLGNKLFAVPWQAFKLKIREHAFTLNVSKETFDNAEGFDKDHWPLTREELSRTYTYYGYQPYWQIGEAGVSAAMPAETESERMARMERETKARTVSTTAREMPDFLSAGTIKEDKVVNRAGEDLGKIEELMIDLENGRISYAVLSFGGFLGMADKLFAIPWQALTLRLHEHAFLLDISKDVLEKAEGFDKDHWPLTREELSRTYTYYGYKPYWQGEVVERAEIPRETQPQRTTRTEREKSFETAEELIAEQEKERIEQLEKKETDKERLEQLEREKAIAERREHKYH
ncbi:MAG TPA: PRC-barrel domain-containing protein [Methanosarcina sp.]|nr:PRC-barrel domain-containing protein [Methanosarcina sp.]